MTPADLSGHTALLGCIKIGSGGQSDSYNELVQSRMI